ncbi:MAG: iron-sulfur cluster assembly accessory protein [Archangiaceae bacterium]|nr:iron-sulfur cluster assembly accessory protein [Archangiaceae bacterium]
MENVAAAEVQAPVAPEEKTSKVPFVLTPAALAQVKQVMAEQKLDDHLLTVRVVPAGCSGLGYDLNLMKEAKAGDQIWEQDGVKICTDPVSVKYLSGTSVDYLVTDTASGFKFINPLAKSSCGCGTSFSV